MTVRIGAGTGWARDRFSPALDLVQRGRLDYLFFEAMSEVTMSAAQVARESDPTLPRYDPDLLDRIGPVLADARRNETKIISNQGWLDPVGAAQAVAGEARRQGFPGLRIAAIAGSDISDQVSALQTLSWETGEPICTYRDDMVSAEAYLGSTAIAAALREGADIVITSRITDSALVLGPLTAEFGWAEDDWDALAFGVVVGHLIECGAQVTGGYFADPGYKDVPDLANIGYPIAEVDPHSAIITKLPGTGGIVSKATCAEQLLYEVNDPSRYLSPDVVCDLTAVRFDDLGDNRVRVSGGRGEPAPDTLKALVGVREGWASEGMMLFAGPGAMNRAELARAVLEERLEQAGFRPREIRFDFLGLNAVHREATPEPDHDVHEVILRVAAASETKEQAGLLTRELEPMAVSGPSGTGKFATMGSRIRPIIGLHSTLIPRSLTTPSTSVITS